MRWYSGFSILLLGGALMASPAFGNEGATRGSASPYERLPLPYGDALTMQDKLDRKPIVEGVAIDKTERTSIEGQVAEVDRERGRLVLDTDQGQVGVVTNSDQLTNIDVGDVVRVSFVYGTD